MKKDKLEEFINTENEAFENNFNEALLWEKIENRIIEKPKKNKINWYAAASIVLLLAVGWLATERIMLTDKVTALEQVMIEGENYSQIEHYYTQTISQKRQLVNEKASKIDFPINKDLTDLQERYEALKVQLKENGTNEKVLNAMIHNLRTQIDLLNEQLSIIESIQEYVKTENTRNHEIQI